MSRDSSFHLLLAVFALVSASFTNIYLTQPVLPVLQSEFGVDVVLVSFSVSAVILGIAISNLPFGALADRIAVRPILLCGGMLVASGGFICALTENFYIFLGARFLQGLFIPCLTTCLAAYLAKTLPAARLNIAMGWYVSATVFGGLSGRLLGGWIHPPLHWRYAFVSASLLTLAATYAAMRGVTERRVKEEQREAIQYSALLARRDLIGVYLCGMGSFAIFSSVFNYLPFRLSASPFLLNTEQVTLLYLVYLAGVFMGPLSGRLSNRFGSGKTLLAGSVVVGGALVLILLPSVVCIILGLLALCGGFFTVHAAAIGALNRKLKSGQGHANGLYVLFYYLGGWLGITGFGYAYQLGGWSVLTAGALLVLLVPVTVACMELRMESRKSAP